MAYDGPWEPKSKTLKSMPLGLFLLLLGDSGPSATWGVPPCPYPCGLAGLVVRWGMPHCLSVLAASCLKNTGQVPPVAAKARGHIPPKYPTIWGSCRAHGGLLTATCLPLHVHAGSISSGLLCNQHSLEDMAWEAGCMLRQLAHGCGTPPPLHQMAALGPSIGPGFLARRHGLAVGGVGAVCV